MSGLNKHLNDIFQLRKNSHNFQFKCFFYHFDETIIFKKWNVTWYVVFFSFYILAVFHRNLCRSTKLMTIYNVRYVRPVLLHSTHILYVNSVESYSIRTQEYQRVDLRLKYEFYFDVVNVENSLSGLLQWLFHYLQLALWKIMSFWEKNITFTDNTESLKM